jgi:hypothetical protein
MRARSLCGLLSLALVATVADAGEPKVIYNSPADVSQWRLNRDKKPVPAANAQADGLNPHGSGGYIVMHETPVKDFVLDFEYKLSKGCNTGVFLRVGDPANPVYTGLEIAIDDTTGTGVHDTGAIYDLVAPKTNAQKPTGEWNHMVIRAEGPLVTVTLNGQEVSRLNHDEWTEAGKRPDGSSHKFTKVAIRDLNQKGYFGFQDHGQDCWFRNVKLEVLDK